MKRYKKGEKGMKRGITKLIATMMVSMMTISLVGCGNGNTPTKEQEKDTSTICIYTNNGSEGRDEWLINKAKEAGFDIQVVSLGASEVTNRMIAEKNNPLCDVVFGLNNIEYEKLKDADCLQQWKPDWSDGVDQSLVDKDGYYYPVTTTPLLLIGNAEYQNMPTDWIDLAKDEYKGLYQLHNLGGGTANTVYASIISRYKDPSGELGVSKEGWEIASKILGNAHNITEGEDSIGEIIDGTYPLDEHWASGVLTEEKTRDYKFQIMTPEVGVPYVVESLAIAKDTDNYEKCVEFCNWLGSSDMQLEWSNNFGTIPCQEEALKNVGPDIKELMGKLKPQDLDWAFIAENIDAWVEKAELEFVK